MDTQEKNNVITEPIIITSSDNNDSVITSQTERITLEEIYKLAKKIYESA